MNVKTNNLDSGKVHIITGATGFVGSKLARRFLDRGDKLILFVRTKEGVNVEDRIRSALSLSNTEMNRVRVLEVDITKPINSQINIEELNDIFSKVDDIWHLAAYLSFKYKNKDITNAVNIEGTRNIVNLASSLNIHLYYFSTAYVHGRRRGLLKEDELIVSKYNNYYEESKFATELILKDVLTNKVNYTIFRPSIIYNIDSVDNQMLLSGYYVLLLSFKSMKDAVIEFINKYPRRAKILGLSTNNESVVISKYIPVPVTGTNINLIPLHVLLDIVFAVYDNEGPDMTRTYHVVSPEGLNMQRAMQIMLSGLGVQAKVIRMPHIVVRLYFKIVKAAGKLLPKVFGNLANKMKYYEFYLLNSMKFNLRNIYSIIPEDKYRSLFNHQDDMLSKATNNFLN